MMIFLINDNGWSHWRSCLYLADKNMIFFQFVSDHIFPGISWAQSSISHGCIALLAPSHYPSSPHFSLAVYPIFKIDSEPPLWFSPKNPWNCDSSPNFSPKKGPPWYRWPRRCWVVHATPPPSWSARFSWMGRKGLRDEVAIGAGYFQFRHLAGASTGFFVLMIWLRFIGGQPPTKGTRGQCEVSGMSNDSCL